MNVRTYPRSPVLIVDDEQDVLRSYKIMLQLNKINNLVLCSDGREVMGLLGKSQHSTILLDLSMPAIDGRELIGPIKEQHPEIPIIVITAHNTVSTAVDCMKRGAYDYMVKPVEESRLISGLKNAVELSELRCENSSLKKNVFGRQIGNIEAFSSFVTVSDSMLSIFSYIETIASSNKPVLITGESGVGKELIARSLHTVSGRQGKFVPVNVAGLDDAMFSDTLFGHRKGAYSGALSDRQGLIEEASGGSLFLDEIGSLELSSQIKLLRLLQEREYYPLGSDVCKEALCAVIAATNEDLQMRIKEGRFRNDLYYRLLTHNIHIPPLRERPDDIPVLLNQFITESASSLHKPVPALPPGLLELLHEYSFPGNVREMQALVFDAVSRCSSQTLDMSHFRQYIAMHTGMSIHDIPIAQSNQMSIPFFGEFPKLREMEEYLVTQAIIKSGWNQSEAAKLLGVAQSTLSRRFNKNKQ